MLIVAALLLAITVLSVYFYNRLVALKNMASEGWSGVDVQLKRRHELIPNLVEIVKGYASHERETLEEVVKLRGESRASTELDSKTKIENDISKDIKKIFALVEAYPNLKADTNFRKLQDNLVEIEDALQYSRRYYNGTVRDYNTLTQSFPANLLAKYFSFEPLKFFELDYATERKSPDVSFN